MKTKLNKIDRKVLEESLKIINQEYIQLVKYLYNYHKDVLASYEKKHKDTKLLNIMFASKIKLFAGKIKWNN